MDQFCPNCYEFVGLDPESYSEGHYLHENLGEVQQALFRHMQELPDSPAELREVMDLVVGFLGEDNIKLSYPEYQQGDWYERVREKVLEYLFQSCQTNSKLDSCLG